MIGGGILAVLAYALAVFAVSAVSAAEAPPDLVGRINAIEGAVTVRPAGGAWADWGVNEPVAAGMSLRTGAQGRAILRVGTAAVALAPGSEIAIAELGPGGRKLMLRQGRIGVRLSLLDADPSFEIEMPRGVVRLQAAGEYDITAGDGGTAGRIAVFEGAARVAGKGIDDPVAPGSAMLLSGSDPVPGAPDAAAVDAFDAWWQWAVAEPADPPALHYVPAAMTGYDVLDEHGTWRTVAGIGAVWTPNSVPDDWAPYRFGHWRHIAPWGWTWIDDMAWGFAPSHYGRWTRLRGRDDDEPEHWAWVPGGPVTEPAYMPAAVAFLGTAGVGLSYPNAFGPAVAWFPLAPGEIYWPDYTDDLGAIRRINAGAVADLSPIDRGANGDPPAEIVHDEYLYRRFASVVPRAVFLAGRPVAPALVQLPQRRLANAPLIAGSPQIAAAAPAVPRPAAPAAVAVARTPGRGLDAKLAHAVQTLSRILKPQVAPAAARPAVLVRSAPPSVKQAHAAPNRPAHARIAAAAARPAQRQIQIHLAAATRRR